MTLTAKEKEDADRMMQEYFELERAELRAKQAAASAPAAPLAPLVTKAPPSFMTDSIAAPDVSSLPTPVFGGRPPLPKAPSLPRGPSVLAASAIAPAAPALAVPVPKLPEPIKVQRSKSRARSRSQSVGIMAPIVEADNEESPREEVKEEVKAELGTSSPAQGEEADFSPDQIAEAELRSAIEAERVALSAEMPGSEGEVAELQEALEEMQIDASEHGDEVVEEVERIYGAEQAAAEADILLASWE